ncbi:hypothetical protein LPJ75_002179, partial [Coemansia sp. RSA 2598]
MVVFFGRIWDAAMAWPLVAWPAAATWMLAAGYLLVSNKGRSHVLPADAAAEEKEETCGKQAVLENRVDIEKHPCCAEHHCSQHQTLLPHAAGGAKRRQRGRSRKDAVPLDVRGSRSASRRSRTPSSAGISDDSSTSSGRGHAASGSLAAAAALSDATRGFGFGHAASDDPVVEMGSRRPYHPSPIGHRPGGFGGGNGSARTGQRDAACSGIDGVWPAAALDLRVLADSRARADARCAAQP